MPQELHESNHVAKSNEMHCDKVIAVYYRLFDSLPELIIDMSLKLKRMYFDITRRSCTSNSHMDVSLAGN